MNSLLKKFGVGDAALASLDLDLGLQRFEVNTSFSDLFYEPLFSVMSVCTTLAGFSWCSGWHAGGATGAARACTHERHWLSTSSSL